MLVTNSHSDPQKSGPSENNENMRESSQVGMDQYLLIPFLVGWTSIYQLFWCSPGVQGFDPSPSDSFWHPSWKLSWASPFSIVLRAIPGVKIPVIEGIDFLGAFSSSIPATGAISMEMGGLPTRLEITILGVVNHGKPHDKPPPISSEMVQTCTNWRSAEWLVFSGLPLGGAVEVANGYDLTMRLISFNLL